MSKITLRSAREACGYSVKEIANYCGLTEDCYKSYEEDFGKTPARIVFAIRSLLKIRLDHIYI